MRRIDRPDWVLRSLLGVRAYWEASVNISARSVESSFCTAIQGQNFLNRIFCKFVLQTIFSIEYNPRMARFECCRGLEILMLLNLKKLHKETFLCKFNSVRFTHGSVNFFQVKAVKGFWKNLPYNLCNDNQVAAPAKRDTDCWNGRTRDRYLTISIYAQKLLKYCINAHGRILVFSLILSYQRD